MKLFCATVKETNLFGEFYGFRWMVEGTITSNSIACLAITISESCSL